MNEEPQPQSEGPWPECNRKTGEDCMQHIKTQAKDVTAFIVSQYDFVTDDYQTNRVRIFVDDEGLVSQTPVRG